MGTLKSRKDHPLQNHPTVSTTINGRADGIFLEEVFSYY